MGLWKLLLTPVLGPLAGVWYLGSEITSIAKSVAGNVIYDKVSSLKVGSVVYCNLVNRAEHSGIYIGNNSIVHLDGSGLIEIVSPSEFLNRLGGFNLAISIFVSCKDGVAVGNSSVGRRAKSMVGKQRKYSLLMDNCHQFSSGCLTGDFENSSNFFWMLKNDVEKNLGGNEWRVWDI